MEEYKTIGRESRSEFTVKRSKFISSAKPVETPDEAEEFIRSVRAEHFDAKHNVFAYRTLGGAQKCSDDGEPQGTGGVPVLNAVIKSGAVNAAVVVTRYFGGVLLGAGGLIRAYSRAASDALSKAGIITMEPCIFAQTHCSYGEYKTVSRLILLCGAQEDGTFYTDKVTVKFHIKSVMFQEFQKKLADMTGGQRSASVLKEGFCPGKQ